MPSVPTAADSAPPQQLHWKHHEVFPSFDVSDLDSNDAGAEEALLRYLETENPHQASEEASEEPAALAAHAPLILAHFLGVDHAGHSYQARHTTMERKLAQLETMLRRVAQTLDARAEATESIGGDGDGSRRPPRTLMLVIGDHGMTASGDHGGSSPQETDSFLFAELFEGGGPVRARRHVAEQQGFVEQLVDMRWQRNCAREPTVSKSDGGRRDSLEGGSVRDEDPTCRLQLCASSVISRVNATFSSPSKDHPSYAVLSPLSAFRQVDLVPTLAVLLGVPIPYGSTGRLIPELLAVAGLTGRTGGEDSYRWRDALHQNHEQLCRLLMQQQLQDGHGSAGSSCGLSSVEVEHQEIGNDPPADAVMTVQTAVFDGMLRGMSLRLLKESRSGHMAWSDVMLPLGVVIVLVVAWLWRLMRWFYAAFGLSRELLVAFTGFFAVSVMRCVLPFSNSFIVYESHAVASMVGFMWLLLLLLLLLRWRRRGCVSTASASSSIRDEESNDRSGAEGKVKMITDAMRRSRAGRHGAVWTLVAVVMAAVVCRWWFRLGWTLRRHGTHHMTPAVVTPWDTWVFSSSRSPLRSLVMTGILRSSLAVLVGWGNGCVTGLVAVTAGWHAATWLLGPHHAAAVVAIGIGIGSAVTRRQTREGERERRVRRVDAFSSTTRSNRRTGSAELLAGWTLAMWISHLTTGTHQPHVVWSVAAEMHVGMLVLGLRLCDGLAAGGRSAPLHRAAIAVLLTVATCFSQGSTTALQSVDWAASAVGSRDAATEVSGAVDLNSLATLLIPTALQPVALLIWRGLLVIMRHEGVWCVTIVVLKWHCMSTTTTTATSTTITIPTMIHSICDTTPPAAPIRLDQQSSTATRHHAQDFQQNLNHRMYSTTVSLVLLHAVAVALCSTIASLVLRGHLMTTEIFAPKLMYDVAALLTVSAASLTVHAVGA